MRVSAFFTEVYGVNVKTHQEGKIFPSIHSTEWFALKNEPGEPILINCNNDLFLFPTEVSDE